MHSSPNALTGAGAVFNHGTVDAQGLNIAVSNFENFGLMEVRPGGPNPSFDFLGLEIQSDHLINDSTGRIESSGGPLLFAAGTLTNAGLIETITGTFQSIEFVTGTVTNLASGMIQSAAGSITFDTIGNVTNDGTIGTTGGLVNIAAFLAGSGIVTLQGNGTVEVENATSKTESLDFVGAGTLALDQPTFVPSTINGFSLDDTIGLGVAATAIGYTSGDLKMQLGGGQTFDLAITGPHTLADFIVGTRSESTTINLACFAAGTLIRTTRGPVPVERLREGDLVVLADADNALPIVWIGHRTVDCQHHPKPASVWPVCIAAGAFAHGVPRRDLYLSPDHAVFVDDVLIPVKYMVNDTIITTVQRNRITYYHVELPRHAVLLAEGLAAESLLPTADRSAFANSAGAVTLNPDFHSHAWEAQGCAPLVVTGPLLAAIRARLQRRAFDRPALRRA